MEAKHTQGRLQAKQDNLFLEAGRYRMASRITACGSSKSMEDEVQVAQANASRLAACWNACEGISTELLESFAAAAAKFPGLELWAAYTDKKAEAEDLTEQRDALLEALRHIIALPSHPMRKKAVEIATSAIAKATGGAA